MTSLSLNILGCVDLSCDQETIELAPASQLLLGCLALHASDAPLRRERLAEMLWPDMDAQSQKARLRTALWRLKKATCGVLDDVLLMRSETVALCAAGGLSLMQARFEHSVLTLCAKPLETMTEPDSAALADIVNTYKGPLMEGHDADWITPARERFSDLYSTALERQITHLRATGRDHESIRSSQALLALDPYREDVHATLIALYGQSGRPARAMQQYQSCAKLMEQDLGVSVPQAQRTLDHILAPEIATEPARDLTSILRTLEAGVRDLNRQIKDLKLALGRPKTANAKHDRVV